jgi:hypothetical protein
MTKIATKADCNNLLANSFIATTDLTKCPTVEELSNAPQLTISQSATNEQCVKLSSIGVNYSIPLTIKVTNNRNVRINITYANVYACVKGGYNVSLVFLGSASFADVGANYTATRTVNIDLSKIKDPDTAALTTDPNVSLDKEIDLRVVVGKTTSNNRTWNIRTNITSNSSKYMTTDTPWIQVPLNYGTASSPNCITGGEGLGIISTFTFTCTG